MDYIGFLTLAQALRHRADTGCGGWVFATPTGPAILFVGGQTASGVMLHPATRGLSGTLH